MGDLPKNKNLRQKDAWKSYHTESFGKGKSRCKAAFSSA